MGVEVASVSLHIPTQTAGTTDEWYVAWPFSGKWQLDTIEFAPATAVAKDGTNNLVSTITQNDGAGGSSNSVASHDTTTSGTALVVGTTVEPTVTKRELRKGYIIKVAKTINGTGSILDGTYTFAATKVN